METRDAKANLCELEGCDEPLPDRGLDEQGRAKGGRRARYCSKAHTDAASRQRRARDIASIADPLALAQSAGEAFLPSARLLAEQLTEVIARFDQAESGALARVQAAEQEAAEAVAEAAEARTAGEHAEQARRQALAQSRLDQQAGQDAVRQAEQAGQEAEQVRAAAWEQVAAHERARGQAEAARAAAQGLAERLVAENRELSGRIEQVRTAIGELTARLSAAQLELERVRGEGLAMAVRAEAAEHLNAQAGDRFREHREQVAALEARAAAVQAELDEQRAARAAEPRPAPDVRREKAHRPARKRRIAGAPRIDPGRTGA